ncbi:MAG: type III pantothenate kinase [Rubrobacter sp.]|nr:type III pantothenate kinase [Rubrobacter sp.]
MLMAVDIGNTQTVLGFFEGERLRASWRMTTEPYRSPDEIGAACAALFALRGMSLEDADAMIVSSVVPDLTGAYRHLAGDILRVPFYSVGPEMDLGMENRYDDPSAVGADRLVNAVAACRYYGAPAIIADSGTATTVCAVDAGGAYRGGAILPGLYVSMDALASRTAKLPRVDLEEEPPRAIATNTPDSIRSGFIYGYAGAIDALIRRFKDELAAEGSIEGLRVVATGGLSPVISRYCREIEVLDPDLTLKGLQVLYALNASRAR